MTLAELQSRFWDALRGAPVDASFLRGEDRLQVYAEMFVWRQVDALRADFPQTAARLGDDAFFALARNYFFSFPSEDPDLGRLGRGFAAFCPEGVRDLAALEWARSEVFLEADAVPMPAADFAQRLQTRIVPALRLVGRTAVWRPHGAFEVSEVTLDADEARALALAMSGASFVEVCGAFGEPARAYQALQSWIAEGWIAA
jgi:hypothetical protein